MRKLVSFLVQDVFSFKNKLLQYANAFTRCTVLDSNDWKNSSYEMLVACGSIDEIIPEKNSFESLKKIQNEKNDWLFGYLSYDLKNETENLSSKNHDGLEFPQMHFFQPEYVFRLTAPLPACLPVRQALPTSACADASVGRGERAKAEGGNPRSGLVEIGFLPELSSEKKANELFNEILNTPCRASGVKHQASAMCRISKEEYIRIVNKLKQHIHRGDIYEINYCMEFFSKGLGIDLVDVFMKLNEASETPFSAFYRLDDKFLLCASPERFLKKSGKKIISQPMKGTAKRGATIPEDAEIKLLLSQNEKEKSENVMIVDLVRNDLSKTCTNVSVDELFGVYTFKQWHQMISTVSGEIKDNIHFTDVIKNAFPMGSMTGAPKVRAMELIEKYEKTKRGLYSGSVGYISPNGDFDFNVVIRSILYNSSSKYLSFQVGSAITAHSIPENEYEECLLKAKGMFEALSPKNENHKQYPNSNIKIRSALA